MLPILELARHFCNYIRTQTIYPKTNNLISANSKLLTQSELRLTTLTRQFKVIIYTLRDYEFLILESKHPTVLVTDHEPTIFFPRRTLIQIIEYRDFK